MGKTSKYKSYLKYYFLSLLVLLLSTLAINMAVDPLWHYKGNIITKVNFIFNERESKINRILSDLDSYDCLIFGSSRVASLNENLIKNYKCYNMGFSGALIDEVIDYAKYMKNLEISPKLIILGVDFSNFLTIPGRRSAPQFIHSFTKPPSFIESYLSYGVLNKSILTLLNSKSWYDPRHYRYDFTMDFDPDVPEYNPEKNEEMRVKRFSQDYVDNVSLYSHFASIFPEARKIFYNPPVSIWLIKLQQETGFLESYLKSIHNISKLGVTLIDFSLPSQITKNVSNTYDGIHYDRSTNILIASRLNGLEPNFGILVNDLSLQQYKAMYTSRIDYYLETKVTSGTL